MADDELIELATRELAQLGLVSAEQVFGGAVVGFGTFLLLIRRWLKKRMPSKQD